MDPCDPTINIPGFAATLVQEEGGTPILSVFGEIDLNTVHDLIILMLKAVAEAGEGGSVIVDLSGVEFMGLSGHSVHCRPQEVRIVSPSPGPVDSIPEQAVRVACAAFPKGPKGPIYEDAR